MRACRNFIDIGLALFYGLLAIICVFGGLAMSLGKQPLLVPSVIFAVLALFLGRLSYKRWTTNKHQVATAHKQQHEDARELQPGEFFTRVVGTSHANPNGSDRQAAIRKHCAPGALLEMVREPSNSFDSNAIGVHCGGAQIGYLTSELADQYAPEVDAGRLRLSGRVANVTGGTGHKKTLGVNIVLTRTEL